MKHERIVQITNEVHPWFGCTLVVDEEKSWGVRASICVPQSNMEHKISSMPTNLEKGEYEYVGTLVL